LNNRPPSPPTPGAENLVRIDLMTGSRRMSVHGTFRTWDEV